MLSFAAKAHSKEWFVVTKFINFFMGKNYCHKKYLESVLKEPIRPRGRHEKFSSIGNDLTSGIFRNKTYKTNRRIDQIVIHCTATPHRRILGAREIDNMHLNRWGPTSGCGYHYVIKLDGTIEKGRWADYSGAHVKGHNTNTLAIAYIGGVDNNLNPMMNSMTNSQEKSLIKLTSLLSNLYRLKKDSVLGHNEFPGVHKACPCLTMDKVRRKI